MRQSEIHLSMVVITYTAVVTEADPLFLTTLLGKAAGPDWSATYSHDSCPPDFWSVFGIPAECGRILGVAAGGAAGMFWKTLLPTEVRYG